MGDPLPHAVETTCLFLKSRRGVRQALYVCFLLILGRFNLL